MAAAAAAAIAAKGSSLGLRRVAIHSWTKNATGRSAPTASVIVARKTNAAHATSRRPGWSDSGRKPLASNPIASRGCS